MKERIDKLDFIKIKNFCWAKNTANRMKRQATDWEMYTKDLPEKERLSKIYEEFLKLNNKKTNNPI